MLQIIEDRRALHQIPELDRQLPETLAYLTAALAPLRCRLLRPMAGALCAYFDFGAAHTIAFRSDADALPVQEQTGLPFASHHPGKMHACGHDAHMAMLLELARRLDRMAALPQNILLVFQPAEETTGGARDLCQTGIFREYGVEAIFGMHLWPDLPSGVIASRRNEMMSRSCEVTVEITGRSAHIAKAAEGIDALAAGVDFYQQVMAAVDALPPQVFRLCKFGRMESGTVRNAVSAHTVLEGSLRAFQDEIFTGLQARIRAIGRDVALKMGCQVEVTMNDGYPAVMNPGALFDRVLASGLEFVQLDAPVMITEDFSWYQRQLPGMFFFLGVGPAPALHAADFQFDEAALQRGADFWEQLARQYRP